MSARGHTAVAEIHMQISPAKSPHHSHKNVSERNNGGPAAGLRNLSSPEARRLRLQRQAFWGRGTDQAAARVF